MTQTTGRVFDEIAKLMTDAAGAAQGVRNEIETVLRAQGERMLREMDVVSREEFEAARAMAEKARTENERLEKLIEQLTERVQRLEAARASN